MRRTQEKLTYPCDSTEALRECNRFNDCTDTRTNSLRFTTGPGANVSICFPGDVWMDSSHIWLPSGKGALSLFATAADFSVCQSEQYIHAHTSPNKRHDPVSKDALTVRIRVFSA